MPLQISTAGADAALTPAQKRFNTLIRQIDEARQQLAAWRDNVPWYRQQDAAVLRPLLGEVLAAHRQWLLGLDALMDQKGWTKAERATVREFIRDELRGSLQAGEDDPELKALYDRNSEADVDTRQRETREPMNGDEEAVSEEELFARLNEEWERRAAAEEQERSARKASRRKSATEQRREAEAQQATQSVREIYRKLASALHPDRATDAAQREEKTALMQRVNQAYAANDLLALLELQLQIEQIDASHIARASDQRLRHYNKVLGEQLAELKSEVERVDLEFRAEFGIGPFAKVHPDKLGETLQRTRRAWLEQLQWQQGALRMLRNTTAVKQWIKQLRRGH